ncbi:MAG TPA: N-methyl-L-tryptophan oxidase [Candidatus Baltobacteraceae bacterium]|nr:N-methyl-L-tryptophan oxidase [Candidatus Baltobacteraceae bacterium]
MKYDVAVIGLGGMGSAVAAHLARRGLRVAGFEQFTLVHDLGSSAGRTRIIRKAYFEDPAYVPLLERAYALWRELEDETLTALLDLFGVLMIGQPDAASIRGVARAAAAFDIPIEHLDAAQVRARFPLLRPLDGEVAILEPYAGVVFPERAIAAHLRMARKYGAELHERTWVRSFEPSDGGVRLVFEGGESVEAAHVAVCAGPWTSDLLGQLGATLTVQRNVQYWFAPRSEPCGPDRVPAFFLERADLLAPVYGIPDLGDGLKIAFHGHGESSHADRLDRDVHESEIGAMRTTLAKWIPDAGGELCSVKACMYTMTPDAHFAIGRVPGFANIVVACGFSGHGFKFAPAIGEIVAQTIADGAPKLDARFLALERFTGR